MRGRYMATYIADRYRIKRKDIGGGSMASIHLCEDIDVEDEELEQLLLKCLINLVSVMRIYRNKFLTERWKH